MSTHTDGHSANAGNINPKINPNINPKVRVKDRANNGNGQSIAGSKLSDGIKGVLADLRTDKSAQRAGTNAVELGPNASATGVGGIAIGSAAKSANGSTGLGNVAIGEKASARTGSSGYAVTAIGAGATAGTSGYSYATAIGAASLATYNSTAVGANASATDTGTALGQHAQVTIGNSVALGDKSIADRDHTVSVGRTGDRRQIVNMAAGTQGKDGVIVDQLSPVVTALGGGASIDPATGVVSGPRYTLANGGAQTTLSGALSALDKAVSDGAGGAYDKYMAIKTGVDAEDLQAQAGSGATALGPNANANEQSAVALGGNTVAGYNAVAIGTRSQGTGRDSSALGWKSTASGTSSTAVGNGSTASGTAATVLGQAASGTGNYSVAVGIQSNAVGSNTVALGVGAISNKGSSTTDGDGNIALGAYALVDNTGAGAIAIGRNAKINNSGGDSSVTGAGAIALGDGATAYGNHSAAIGRGAYTGYPGGIALGDSAKVLSGTASVALGANTLADADMTVSVGNKSTGLRHRIVNMDAGKETYDAVNVNQLQPVMDALGGGASIDPATGEVKGRTYTLANGGTQTTSRRAISTSIARKRSTVGSFTRSIGR